MAEKSPYPKIDKLRAKFDADQPLTLLEACFVLWAEHWVCSSQYILFAYWFRKQKLPIKTMRWCLWYAIFKNFTEKHYPSMRNDLDLNLKARRSHDRYCATQNSRKR